MRNKSIFMLFILMLLHSNIYSHKPTKRAIVIGASSGMGRAVAKLLAQDGYTMGLAARRIHLLKSLQKEIKTKSYIKQIDVSDHKKAAVDLQDLINEIGGLDLILISVSSYSETLKRKFTSEQEKKTIDVDLIGFWTMAKTALDFFKTQGFGHLVGISSMSGLRGSASNPAYCGAKAFISRYLESIRNRMLQNNIPIYVTDIIPGWVDVEHTAFSQIPGTYWVTPLDKAAKQIFDAIKSKKKVAYISKRQIIIAALLKIVPDCIFNWIGEF